MSFLSRFFIFFLPGCLILVLTFFFSKTLPIFCLCARLLLAPECLSELSLCQLQINKAISQLVRPYNLWRIPSPPPMHFVHRLFQGQSTLPARCQSHSRVFAASIVKKKTNKMRQTNTARLPAKFRPALPELRGSRPGLLVQATGSSSIPGAAGCALRAAGFYEKPQLWLVSPECLWV